LFFQAEITRHTGLQKVNLGFWDFTEPLQTIPNFEIMIVPGPDEEAVNVRGKILDRDRFANILKEYYRLRGWDEETGLPKAETLASLGLDDLVSTTQ
jgi:aldehyde:ferredoxin oxidoreductase